MFGSPIIQVYLTIAGSVLGFAGLAIAVLKWGLKKNVDHAWRAYRGWLFMIPPVIGAVLLGRIATIVFFGLIAIVGFTEFARATGLYRDWLITGLVYLGIAGVTTVTSSRAGESSSAGTACSWRCRCTSWRAFC